MRHRAKTDPPALAMWLLQQLAASNYKDAILGDLSEQYANGKSRFWFYKEVFAAIVGPNGSMNMRRIIVWTFVLAIGFSFGFWVARSPLVVIEEMPSADRIEARHEEQTSAKMYDRMTSRSGTLEFVQMELSKARAQRSSLDVARWEEQLRELQIVESAAHVTKPQR